MRASLLVEVRHSLPVLLYLSEQIIDYDGGKPPLHDLLGQINQDFPDTARITWMSEIVSAFKPPPSSPPPDGFLNEYFERDVETVLDFCNQHKGKSEDQLAIETRTILLSGLSNTRVGIYSRFHDNATYHFGYDHPVTIRLAYMYENLLSLSVILSVLNSISSHHHTGLRRV